MYYYFDHTYKGPIVEISEVNDGKYNLTEIELLQKLREYFQSYLNTLINNGIEYYIDCYEEVNELDYIFEMFSHINHDNNKTFDDLDFRKVQYFMSVNTLNEILSLINILSIDGLLKYLKLYFDSN